MAQESPTPLSQGESPVDPRKLAEDVGQALAKRAAPTPWAVADARTIRTQVDEDFPTVHDGYVQAAITGFCYGSLRFDTTGEMIADARIIADVAMAARRAKV